ncbi:MAG: T9SS type A sorting domain-containing protein [Bacteroidota bacterium]
MKLHLLKKRELSAGLLNVILFFSTFLLTGLIGNRLYAQPANTYSFAASSGTFTPNVGGTATSLATTADFGISTAFPIGFTFNFDGNNYTQVMASADGVLLFGTGRAATGTNNLATTTATQRPGIAALWDDLQCRQGVNYLLSGTAPNRVLTVEWLNMEWNWGANNAVMSFQVRLYETTNVLDIIYRQEANAGNPGGSSGASIGIMGVASNNFISLTNTTTSPGTSTTTSTNSIAVRPTTGQIYTFTPPPVCSGTPIPGVVALTNIPGCGTGNYVLAVTGASTNPGLSYQWQSSPDSITWTAMTNDTLVGLTKPQVTALTYFRRVTTCTNSSLNATSNFIAVKPVYAGTANATAPICGDSLTLTLTGASASISSFQWESSVDNITFNPIAGATLASQKVPTPLANTWYRAVVFCAASSSAENSISVPVRPARGGTTSIISSNCLDSTTLGLTGASTGPVTYNWLSSTDSITWVSMGITAASAKFPSPNATRFYRCVVACGSATDSSVAVRVNEPCQGFGPYSITRNATATFTTIQSTGTPFTWAGTSADDDRTLPVYFPSGFNFTYAGAVRPAFYISTNGWLSFDTATISTSYTNNLNATSPKLVLAPLWDDLYCLAGSSANRNNLLRYQVTGTAPNRVMTVEWAEMELYAYPAPSLNFQIKLYEGSNNIEYVYGRMQPFDGTGSGSLSYTLGMNGNSPASGQRISLLLENSRNFSSSTVNNTLTIASLCNTSYLFTSGGTFNPTNVSSIPSNDSLSTPVVLTVNAAPCTDACGTYYSSLSATSSNTLISPLSGTPDDDVWFQFTAPLSGQVGISLVGSPSYDPAFQVMTSTFDTAGMGPAGSRNISTSTLESVQVNGLTPNATYYIRAFHAGVGAGSASGSFSICVNQIVPPPANDDTSGSVNLNVGLACTPTNGTTVAATPSPQAVCGGLADDDVWYRFTPSASVDTVTVVGNGTFRAHVQVLTRQLVSVSCQNTSINGGIVQTVLTGLLRDSLYYIRVYHTNAGTATGAFTICVNGIQAALPVVQTGTKTNVITSSATLSGNIISDGGYPVTASGIVYSMTPAPVRGGTGVVDSINNPLVSSGSFNKNIAGLSPSVTYYFRAYAVSVMGTAYGADSSFTTPASAVIPSVARIAASNIQTTIATVGGNITSNGGDPVVLSGIVVSTSRNPIIGGVGVVDSTTNPNVALGTFSFNLAGLAHSTKYFYRAYATNGVGTAYSAQDSFTTLPIIATFPYTENFDGATTPWVASAINAATNAWVRGTPAKTFINGAFSAPNAFVTTLTGNYLGTEDCVVLSPQFDFTSLSADPVLRFRHKMDVDADVGYDGGVVEISINGGAWTRLNSAVGTGTNYNTPTSFSWYNDASAFYTLGANMFSMISSSYSSNTNGWIESATILTGAAGQSNVRVRFRFVADTYTDEGWAIDNVEVVNIVTPTTPASNVTITPANTSATVNFTSGNGQGRLVVARLTTTTAVAPTNNTLYTANTAFGSGSTTGTGNFVVFVGNGTSVNVTGLTQLTGYTFDVYEYNGRYMHNAFASAATNATTTLPVQLTDFKAKVNAADVILNWTTAAELNNKGFEIERSTNGDRFEMIGFIKGSGNTNSVVNYQFLDENAFTNTNSSDLYYRLRQIDFDGTSEYSPTVLVKKHTAIFDGTITAQPVPFNTDLQIYINLNGPTTLQISLIDITGKVVKHMSYSGKEGKNMISLNELANLSSGIYMVRINGAQQTHTIKVVKE